MDSHNNKMKILQKAYVKDNNMFFESSNSFAEAINDGFFLLKIPEYIDLSPGIKLSESFYQESNKADAYTGFKNKKNIYFDREHFQTEHILLDQNHRKDLFPEELNVLCNMMDKIGTIVLQYVFQQLEIPKHDWFKISGGSIESKGTQWFACSHYRTNLRRPGCATHKDTGFITVLFINQSGLEAFIEDQWVDIIPTEGYFVINFGASLEILTKYLKYPVKAILHRVKEVVYQKGVKDRYSFASFLNSPANLDLYQYDKDKSLKVYMPVQQFLDEFNKTVWNDKHEKFGILN